MNKRKWLYLLAAGTLIVLSVFIIRSFWLKDEETMTQKELQKIVLDKYQGNLIQETLTNGTYAVELERDTGKYQIELDATSGEVVSLKRTEQTAAIKEEPTDPQPKDETIAEQAQIRKLTQEEAIEIALIQVPGQLDDIELESVDGVSYYFAEIENANGSEAEIQINAITGEVKSVVWED